jgi:hypothetical protein
MYDCFRRTNIHKVLDLLNKIEDSDFFFLNLSHYSKQIILSWVILQRYKYVIKTTADTDSLFQHGM